MTKTILHLCADTGSDTWPYRVDADYEVITIGSDIGAENYTPDRPIHGIIANPVCTEFSQMRRGHNRESNPEIGLELVRECQRIIEQAEPTWWAIENPATGTLRNYLGKPDYWYQPWWFGSPWTKMTALWGNFNIPKREYYRWEDVPGKIDLYVRPGRVKPTLVQLGRTSFYKISEFRDSGMPSPGSDAEFRSLCSQKFAEAFKIANP